MKIPVAKRNGLTASSGITGRARLGRRTRSLVRRLRPGDIAVIDHVDLDQASAQALVDARVAAVVNVSPSTSGRYPNRGPQVLVDAGIPLVDDTQGPVFAKLHDGDQVWIAEGAVYQGPDQVGAGTVLDRAQVIAAAESARTGMASQLETFNANAMEFLRREGVLLLDGGGMPDVRTRFDGRAVVVVSKCFDYEQDLRRLRRFLRERRPVLVGVDDGADALRAAGHRPHLIVGDTEAVSDKTLRCGAEVVVRAPREGPAPGLDRLERLGVSAAVVRTAATSEDAALLLAHSGGAELLVTVGSHTSLEEYLDRGRSGMASSFLTRVRVGSALVDARAVQRLYQSPVRTWQLVLLGLFGLLAVALALAATPVGQDWWHGIGAAVADLWSGVQAWLQTQGWFT
ncbi:MAG: putative cytokinetic ring protein SteA [Actinomycetota bacterium]|nr:putative cytokinetic ring protein SteA [Actinomycetota bacterium]